MPGYLGDIALVARERFDHGFQGGAVAGVVEGAERRLAARADESAAAAERASAAVHAVRAETMTAVMQAEARTAIRVGEAADAARSAQHASAVATDRIRVEIDASSTRLAAAATARDV